MRKIILASHGDLAKGAKTSLEMIIGVRDDLSVYGMYPGDSAADYAAELEREVLAAPGTEFVIVTDLAGASVCNAMYPLTRHENVRLFAGFNLQFLLMLLLDSETPLAAEAAEQLILGARDGLKQLTYQNSSDEEEDF